MVELVREVTVPAPRSDVHRYLADFQHVEEWDPRARSVRRVGGDGSEGSTYVAEVRLAGGRTTEMTYVIDELREPTRIVWSGSSRWVQARDTIDLEDDAGGGTRVRYATAYVFAGLPGPLRGPAAWAATPMLRRVVDEARESLGRTLRERLAPHRP